MHPELPLSKEDEIMLPLSQDCEIWMYLWEALITQLPVVNHQIWNCSTSKMSFRFKRQQMAGKNANPNKNSTQICVSRMLNYHSRQMSIA